MNASEVKIPKGPESHENGKFASRIGSDTIKGCATVDRSDMKRSFVRVGFIMIAIACVPAGRLRAQRDSPLAGVWTLNRSLSEFPREIGFNPSWVTTSGGGGTGASSGAGRGRRGAGGGGGNPAAAPFAGRPESYEDSRRAQLLTTEVRNPPARLTIVDTPAAVTITNELGQSRTLHPDGKEESINAQGVPLGVTSKRDGDELVVIYRVDRSREVRYTYSFTANPARLVVDVQFLEHGGGDKARRVYEPGVGTPTLASTGADPGAAPGAASPRQATPESFDQRPGAELRGLTSLGILVEDLSAQAVSCGLSRDSIESALSKRLTDAGFSVRRNSDDDTYVYVNIMTTSVSSGACVSRYDAFLYTHATATLPYGAQPALVQVSLIHRGGIGASALTAHSAAIVRGLESYVDLFVTQIRAANK